jgi:hypothetical protein
MLLENGIVRLELDSETGSLVQVTDLRTGREHITRRDKGRLFRVFAPDPEEWLDRHADSHLAGRPEMNRSGDTLTARWRDLRTAEGKPAGVAAVVKVRLSPGDDEAFLTLELENSGPFVLCEVVFPWIGGWQGYLGPARGLLQVGTHWPVDPFTALRRNDGWNLMNHTRKLNIGFPHVNIPLCSVGNGSVGLSVNFYPVARDLNFDFSLLDLSERIGDTHPSFGWVHRPFLEPGGRWQSGTVGIAPHSGDWHDAASRMRRWLSGWWRPPAPRGTLHRAIGFHNVMFRDFTGRHLRPLHDMPEIARHGREHGLEHMVVWDMPLLGMYLRAGSAGMYEDLPERRAELKSALREVRAAGVHVSPLTNLRLANQHHPFWKKEGASWAVRSFYGQLSPESLPLRKNTSLLINRALDQGGAHFCQAHPGFQEWALARVREVLDLGFDSVFTDQPFSEDYCFAAGHGHRPGAPGHDAACTWIARAADIVHAGSPDSYVIGEVPDIWNTQYLDLWWFWDWSWLRPEVFRFTLPASLQSWVIDAYDHEDQMARAFAQGFLLNLNVCSLEKTLADVPEFSARVARLAALRARTWDITLAGRFIDRTGLALDSDAEVTAALYETGTGLGLILGEGSRGPGGGGRVKLGLDGTVLGHGPVGDILLYREDGSTSRLAPARKQHGIELEVALDRWEAAVVEIGRA